MSREPDGVGHIGVNDAPPPAGAGDGGEGGGTHLSRSEMRHLERAIRQGTFRLTDKSLIDTPAMLEKIATDKKSCPTKKLRAASVIVQMAKYNLDREKSILAPALEPEKPAQPPVNVHVHGDINLTNEQQIVADLEPYADALRLVLGRRGQGEEVSANGHS